MKQIFVCSVRELTEAQSKKFTFKQGKEKTEGFVVRFKGDFFAYLNQCRHVSLPLDWGDADFFTSDKKFLACKNHGALYLPDTGECVAGPCSGSFLSKVSVQVKNGKVFVTR